MLKASQNHDLMINDQYIHLSVYLIPQNLMKETMIDIYHKI